VSVERSDLSRDASQVGWLPDFCRMDTFFVVMVAVEIIVLAAVLMPDSSGNTQARDVFTASLFAQWLALLSCVLLCQARRWIVRWPLHLSAPLAWAVPVVTSLLGAAAVHRLDKMMGLQMTVPPEHALRFAFSCAAMAGLLTAALLRYFYIQQQWKAQVSAHAQAEVKALQARIRPHFLFNSMNSIASLVRRDPLTAERAIEDLADVFRAALGAGQGAWTLGEEFDLIRRYLAIEQLRLGDRLRTEWRITAEAALDRAIPKLLLQPLVENAVLHGIARLPDGGSVVIQVRNVDAGVEVKIDNPCPPRMPATSGNGHALESVSLRLQHYFGPQAWMAVAPAAGYYSVTLWMPDSRAGGS
jgi:two-component system, LytTR family, sensor histidine kinase AlgZ